MGTLDRLLQEEIQGEARLLDDPVQDGDEESAQVGRIIYKASFEEMEDRFVNYDSVQWCLISLLLVLAWGAGIFMLLYLPVRRSIMRSDFRSRKLYVTDNAIVYKVSRPAWFPCFGVNRTEKCLMLPLVTDVVIEQGCMQSAFNLSSLRIEIAGRSKPSPSDDVQIQGLANPTLFRKVVLMVASSLKPLPRLNDHDVEDLPVQPSLSKSSAWTWGQGTGLSSWQMGYLPLKEEAGYSYSDNSSEKLFEKLEDIRNSLKRIEVLVEAQQQSPKR
ncbi:hypothetical protein SELMODRAFT_186275 [Selaginella moellendorffii]|uniref:DUF7642 domain-containing protein n=1 Tax=Selaginella moellendorffii TaxID=88036 RepID=D8T800_SELML|nr:uncharacterized protein LOC9633392 isoform X1 [Selaginella moellendorffii]EFJ07293.1 hypothetical protein SELMODRAFT_186275 [Selaginella moellendorffii]|eukprot:XP_002991722.1 uncharacterized protein LOC9633392 isoform X1 [Selaginella moellendorffii]